MNRILEKAQEKINHFEQVFKGSTISKISFRINKNDFEIILMPIPPEQPVQLFQINENPNRSNSNGERFQEFHVDGRSVTFIEDDSQLSF